MLQMCKQNQRRVEQKIFQAAQLMGSVLRMKKGFTLCIPQENHK